MSITMLRVLFAVAGSLCLVASVHADDLHLPPDRYWVAMASRQDLNEAIAVARRYGALQPLVVRAINGWYAVVKGPQEARGGNGRAVLDALITSSGIPSDSYFTRGDGYLDVVWRAPPSAVLATQHYDGTADAVLTQGELRVQLSSIPVDAQTRSPTARGFYKDKPAFAMTLTGSPSPSPEADASLVYLDPGSPSPQIVFTYVWPGTQCCTVTKIATMHNDATWKIVDTEALDGSAGYEFEHLSGPGSVEMVSPDQAFHFAFTRDGQAASPTRIRKLIGDQIVDVTEQPQYRDYLVQQLAALEGETTGDPRAWHRNGFLAGWVAAKMLIGQGPDAWSRMLAAYDRNPGSGPEECSTNQPMDLCPEGRKVRIDFPIALKAFLVENGYIREADLYPATGHATRQGSARAVSVDKLPPIDQCVSGSETARELIYRSFVGRPLKGAERTDVVTLKNDTTVEADDPSVGSVTCAVTYDVNVRGLIGRLVGDGDRQRAATLSRLIRDGSTLSNRVKYSVRTTSTAGQSYVELAP